jgi:putative oxidoreductase
MSRTIRQLLFGGSTPQDRFADLGLTVLRVFAGLSLAFAHGLGKIQGPSEQFIAGIQDMGIPFPVFSAWMAAIAEFFGGILLAAGLLTRWSALLILITMLVAGFGMHWMHRGDPYRDMELALLFGAVALAFLLAGSGRFSVDRRLR